MTHPGKIPVNPILKDGLLKRTRPGDLCRNEKGSGIRCFACGHRCFIPEGADGICKVRTNVGGELRVPFGYVGGMQVDPIEKKPFFHVLPGAKALSFGMLGCDFHCAYCQNWLTSQVLRDPDSNIRPTEMSADELVELALKHEAKVIASTYNEPLITSEWSREVFERAREKGIRTAYVSNGNGTPEVLEYIKPSLDFMKIDLKGFRDHSYRELGGVLGNVLATIESVYGMGIWLELVTLLIPDFNDGEEEIRELVKFIAGLSPEIPWHVSAFHPDYKMQDREKTPVTRLFRAAEIAREEGLKYVYIGNVRGVAGDFESTRCPGCDTLVIERHGYHVESNRIEGGRCPDCRTPIAGVWS